MSHEAKGVLADGVWWAWLRSEEKSAINQRERLDKYRALTFWIVLVISILLMISAVLAFLLPLIPGLVENKVDSFNIAVFFLGLATFFGCFTWYRLSLFSPNKLALPKTIDNESWIAQPVGVKSRSIHEVSHGDVSTLIETAADLARLFHAPSIEPLHLIAAGVGTRDGSLILGRLGIQGSSLVEVFNRALNEKPKSDSVGGLELSEKAEEVILQAFSTAVREKLSHIMPADILLEAIRLESFVQDVLIDREVSFDQFEQVVAWVRVEARLRARYHHFRQEAAFKPLGPMNRAMTAVATPFLDRVSEDVTNMSARGRLPLLVGKEETLQEIFRVIESTGRGVLLVGEDGVGKMSILYGVAERMVEETAPPQFRDKRLLLVPLAQLLSGVATSEAEKRLIQVFNDVVRSRNIVLIFPDLQSVASLEGGVSLLSLLADLVERTGILILATTTPKGDVKNIEGTPLNRLFERVIVKEPDTAEATRVLEAKAPSMEYMSGVFFSYAALESCVVLTHRYLHERFLPEKAIQIAQEVSQDVARLRGKGSLIQKEDVERIITQKTQIPLATPMRNEPDLLLNLETYLHDRVIGQEEAVKAVSSALRRSRAALTSSSRPIATFLFLGPTGIGKTELAKALAALYFQKEESMLRFDMSEFQDAGGVLRLIGDASKGEAGRLTEALRKQPFSLVLLDEFEKAHSSIHNLFLQVFDDGRLTDGTGRVIDCTNALFIATSNAGAGFIQTAIKEGRQVSSIKTELLEGELSSIFRPELLNRFDGVIIFEPLKPEEVEQIAHLMIRSLTANLGSKGISFEASDEVIQDLAQRGYDPLYGARPLRRLIQEEVDDAIAKALLGGRVKRRDTIVLQKGGTIDIRSAERL